MANVKRLVNYINPHGPEYLRSKRKRAVDFFGALTLLGMTSPAAFIAAIGIKLDDGGSVFFKRRHLGKNGSIYWMYKYRSMHESLSDPLGEIVVLPKHAQDRRLTRIGPTLRRWSIDELAQLFNVLKGEMLLIGIRPVSPAEFDYIATQAEFADIVGDWQAHYVIGKPGLTGLAQIRGRALLGVSTEAIRRKLEYDIEYVDTASSLLDLMIAAQTPWTIIKRGGAF